MKIVCPVMLSERHIVTTRSAQSSLSGRSRSSDGVACLLALRCAPRIELLPSLGGAVDVKRTGSSTTTGIALGLALVIGVGRPELQRLFPQPRALLAGGGPTSPRKRRGCPKLSTAIYA